MTSRGQRRIPYKYWDTCVFLAWVKNESAWQGDVINGIEQTSEEAYAGSIVIFTSTITLIEFEQAQLTPEHRLKFQQLFTHSNWQLLDVDKRVASKAAVIRQFYDTRKYDRTGAQVSGSFMSLGDSIHLATALQYSATEFQTLDGGGKRTKRVDPLNLNGNVAGAYLLIVKPKFVPPPQPLSGPVPDISGQQATLLFGEPITPEEATKTLEDTNEPIKTLPPPAEVQGSPAGPPASEAGVKSAEAGKPEGSQDGQVATATVGKEEVAPTESKTPAGVKPAGDAKGGS